MSGGIDSDKHLHDIIGVLDPGPEGLNELQLLLQESGPQSQIPTFFDIELKEMTKGGVNAVARQSHMVRLQTEAEDIERQVENEGRARKRDAILAQKGMLQQKNSESNSTE